MREQASSGTGPTASVEAYLTAAYTATMRNAVIIGGPSVGDRGLSKGFTGNPKARIVNRDSTIIKLRFVLVVIAGGLILPLIGVAGDGQDSLTAPATEEEIVALARDLGHPSYETRTLATRRLCAIGMPVARTLRAVADGDDVEAALRAKAILSVLDRLMFSGVQIGLSFTKTKIAWNEPVDLRITMTNRTDYPSRVPFELDPARSAVAADDARQVADMLDAAELLQIRALGRGEIDLTVDDIAADPAVLAAVQERLGNGPSRLLKPGETLTITAVAFNRGWARYRLLDPGTYTAVMEYVPKWGDDALTAQRVGRVISNQARITVTKGAPKAISRAGAEAQLVIDRDGASIVALLTNRTDQSMLVNKDFGSSAPFAQGRWVYELDGAHREVPVVAPSGASWHDFKPALLVEVQPGQSIELSRVAIGDMRRAFTEAGAKLDGQRWTVHFTYMNMCDRQWQIRQGATLLGNPKAPPVFQSLLPRRILSTRHSSNRLVTPDAP